MLPITEWTQWEMLDALFEAGWQLQPLELGKSLAALPLCGVLTDLTLEQKS